MAPAIAALLMAAVAPSACCSYLLPRLLPARLTSYGTDTSPADIAAMTPMTGCRRYRATSYHAASLSAWPTLSLLVFGACVVRDIVAGRTHAVIYTGTDVQCGG